MASYVGLATGAGAAGGLETLLSRLREEELLKQRQQQLDQTGQYQQGMLGMRSRDLDLEEAGLPSLVAQRGASAKASQASAGVNEAKLGILSGLTAGTTDLTGLGERHSPLRMQMHAAGISTDPIENENARSIPEWQARLTGFQGYSPEDVQRAQQSPNAERYYQLALQREQRQAQGQANREALAKQKFDFAVSEAGKQLPPEQLAAFRASLGKRLSLEVQKPYVFGLFGQEVDDQIDAIVSEEMAKIQRPGTPGQTDMPTALPQGVTVTRRPKP